MYYDRSETYTPNDNGSASREDSEDSSQEGLYSADKRSCSFSKQNDNQLEMSGGQELTIERAFDIDALSSFMCGAREIDQLNHLNKRYDASGFYEKNGFIKNGEKIENTIPMYKYLEPSIDNNCL